MRFMSFKIGKSKEKPDTGTEPAGDPLVAQIDGLEEHLNNRTKKLEATEQQLKELSNIAKGSEEDEDAPPQPHGPLTELEVEPEAELLDEETDIGTLLGEAKEEVKIVEVAAGAAAPAKAGKEPAKGGDDSLEDLFSHNEDEVNPLANLIKSLPDVTVQELLNDLQEIKGIIQER